MTRPAQKSNQAINLRMVVGDGLRLVLVPTVIVAFRKHIK